MQTQHTTKLPTRRDVANILGKRFDGWTDKRKNGNRIKLCDRLSIERMIELEKGLRERFPHLDILVENIKWNFGSGGECITTAIYSCRRPQEQQKRNSTSEQIQEDIMTASEELGLSQEQVDALCDIVCRNFAK